MNNIAIFGKGEIAERLKRELNASLFEYKEFSIDHFKNSKGIVFIGSLGICVRYIAPFIESKYRDPAVVCVDSSGKYVIPVISGHIGGANDLARQIAYITGGEAVITTQSDNSNKLSIDTLGAKFGWETFTNGISLNNAIIEYVNGGKCAMLLDIKDRGTEYLERFKGDNIEVFYKFSDIKSKDYKVIIAVSPYIYTSDIPMVTYVPKVLHLGCGCKRGAEIGEAVEQIRESLIYRGINPAAIASVSSVDLKKDEQFIHKLAEGLLGEDRVLIYSPKELEGIDVPNKSDMAFKVTGVYGVAEGSAIKAANYGPLLIEKQKVASCSQVNSYTFALAMDSLAMRGGHIEIVGAGPGDPALISVRGKEMLERADLVLYAGSLVPKELTYYAKSGAVVRSSASMNLEEQFALMKEFYDRGAFIVRLHTGDPCIYGAIQEQMAFFDKYNMRYHITPGISSFLAAAAELKSQFTIPEKVQTIILTRGEGRTAMPDSEKLHKLAQSKSTMCIFLSASVVDKVQEDLLVHYSPTTPVAACYHLTWPDQKIFRGELQNLAKIVKENNLTLTTMIVVGDAIDNREGLSRLYADEFKHLFRK